MRSDTREGRIHGWTIVEMLVVLGILGILAAILAGAMVPMRQSARTISCMNNLRQISTALTAYYADHRAMASLMDGSLPTVLATYINDPRVFVCPVQGSAAMDSYSQYYVPQIPGRAESFLLGCANHTGASVTPAAFAGGRAQSGKTAPVTWNGNPVKPGTEVVGGTLRFADGTTVTVSAGLQVVVVVSFEEAQGKIYSAIRVEGGAVGSLDVQAAHGTHFDVATPACTAGVRGTRFRVTTSESASEYVTQVNVTEGTVAIDGGYPASGQTFLMAGRSGTYARPKETIVTPGSLTVAGPTFNGTRAFYSLTNVGGSPYVIRSVTIGWPTSNKFLNAVAVGGTTVWSGSVSSSPTALTLTGDASARTVSPGATVQLAITFDKAANTNATKYSLQTAD